MTTITLTVISFNGSPSDGALSTTFDELGGAIGRADNNQLVLPDPDRTISRIHAQVAYRAGNYVVIDRGSNAISLNNRPLGNGREMPLGDGDRLQIGGYVLLARRGTAAAPAATDDPFADLLGPASDRPGAPSRGTRAPAAAFDPLDLFDAAPVTQGSRAPAGPAHPGIPDDWDPFANDRAPAPDLARSLGRPAADHFGLDIGAAAPAALIPDLPGSGPGGGDSLDQLFGLKAGSSRDPLANSVLDSPVAQPNMASRADPMQSLNSLAKASTASASDAFSDLHLPFAAPAVARAASPPQPSPPPPSPRAVLSWDNPAGEGHTVIRPAAKFADAAAPLAASPAPTPLSASPFAPTPAPAAPPARARPPLIESAAAASAASAGPARPAAAAAGADALLAALREGLAAPTVQIEALTPELMRLIGQLLHESAHGTVDLLVARAALKREVRAESTMIVARENNPLKFSPSVEAALMHLLSPPTRGFMPAAAAMRDAYDDLRAHQFGFIAGMRAALEGVLARFDPAALESQLSQGSMLESLVPSTRKARMWSVFVEHFEQISNDAADDFHTLFGKAFVKAYEEHIDQLKKDAK